MVISRRHHFPYFIRPMLRTRPGHEFILLAFIKWWVNLEKDAFMLRTEQYHSLFFVLHPCLSPPPLLHMNQSHSKNST